jgi:predicted ABC-type ATPase
MKPLCLLAGCNGAGKTTATFTCHRAFRNLEEPSH